RANDQLGKAVPRPPLPNRRPKAASSTQKKPPPLSEAPADYRANRHAPQDCGTGWLRQPFSAARLTPENEAQDKADSKRRKNRLGRIFPHVLLGIFLKRARTTSRIVPHLFSFPAGVIPGLLGFPAIFSGDRAGRRSQVLGGFARVCLAALQFALRVCHSMFVFFSHWFSPVNFTPLSAC